MSRSSLPATQWSPIPMPLVAHTPVSPERSVSGSPSDTHIVRRPIEQTLSPDAVPQLRSPNVGSASMRKLTYARRKDILYPTALSNGSALDLALQSGQRGIAIALLKHKTNNLSLPLAWQNAVKDRKMDVLRGILLLGYADKSLGFRLLENGGPNIEDAGVLQLMKEIPQFSPKRGRPQSLSAEVSGVECRHLVEDHQEKQATKINFKANFADYKDVKTIANRIIPASERKMGNMKSHAAEVHLIDNRDFGQFVCRQFAAMNEGGETGRQVLMESTNHVMDIGLRIKEKGGIKTYVAKFFDPNQTTTHVRSASRNINAFEFQDVGAYVDGKSQLSKYYPEPKGFSMLYIRPSEDEVKANASLSAGAPPGRTLTSSPANDQIDPIVVHHLMSAGFAGNLRSLRDELEKCPVDKRAALLAAKSGDATPGLFMALHHGHADVVQAFGSLLELIPEEQRADLLASKRADGAPGLYAALQNGHVDAVQSFVELLKLIPEGQRADLLAAKRDDGTPGLYAALHHGHAGAVEAFGAMLELVPPEQRAGLVAAKKEDGITGLYSALRQGHAGAVQAFKASLILVPEEQRAELLAAENEGEPGLFAALENGHADTVKAFGELLELVPKEQRADLLAARTINGLSGLGRALQFGSADTVGAFAELLKMIPGDQRTDLLIHAASGLGPALRLGFLEAVDKYIIEGIVIAPLLKKNERTVLLNAMRASHGVRVGGIWRNYGYYDRIKKEDPAFYLRFKELKSALKVRDRTAA